MGWNCDNSKGDPIKHIHTSIRMHPFTLSLIVMIIYRGMWILHLVCCAHVLLRIPATSKAILWASRRAISNFYLYNHSMCRLCSVCGFCL